MDEQMRKCKDGTKVDRYMDKERRWVNDDGQTEVGEWAFLHISR